MQRLPPTTDDVLLDNLSPSDLFRYSRVSKTEHETVASYMKRTFNIQKLMDRFFTESEMEHFRFLQSHTGMLISGSMALQFFERTRYPGSDLDLYVEHRYCEEIALWLIEIGYSYDPRPGHPDRLKEALALAPHKTPKFLRLFPSSQTDYSDLGVVSVYNFRKSGPDTKIQLITSRHSPLGLILGSFHSTSVMNLITHEKAYSLYPRGTFKDRRSLAIHKENNTNREAAVAAREKYVARGWTLVEALTKDEMRDSNSPFFPCTRYVGDSKCWTIPIQPILSDLPKGYIEMNSWRLLCDAHGTAKNSYTVVAAPTLRFNYLIQDPTLQRSVISIIYREFKNEETHDERLRDCINSYRAW